MRTRFDSHIARDAKPNCSVGGEESVVQRRFVTPLQWSCLHDAASGKTLAPSRNQQHLWAEAEDGAIFHSVHVLSALHRYGFLDRQGKDRYMACEMTHTALTLPVRSR